DHPPQRSGHRRQPLARHRAARQEQRRRRRRSASTGDGRRHPNPRRHGRRQLPLLGRPPPRLWPGQGHASRQVDRHVAQRGEASVRGTGDGSLLANHGRRASASRFVQEISRSHAKTPRRKEQKSIALFCSLRLGVLASESLLLCLAERHVDDARRFLEIVKARLSTAHSVENLLRNGDDELGWERARSRRALRLRLRDRFGLVFLLLLPPPLKAPQSLVVFLCPLY